MERLQQMIGKVCFSFIPNDDGERYIWQYYFIIEPYLTPIRNPRSEKVYDLIATDEAIMEHLVQGKMADKKLAAKERYLVFSMTVFHYQFAFKRRYTIHPHPNSYDKGYFQDPQQFAYMKQVADWSVQMEQEWQGHPEVLEYMKKHPQIELAHIVGVVRILHEVVMYKIQHLLFTCEDKYLDHYYRYRHWYHGADSPLRRLPEKWDDKMVVPVVLHGAVINFFGNRICNRSKFPEGSWWDLLEFGANGQDWVASFILLTRRLVPKEQQQEVLERFEGNPSKNDPVEAERSQAPEWRTKWIPEFEARITREYADRIKESERILKSEGEKEQSHGAN